jgi:hypothetical protein
VLTLGWVAATPSTALPVGITETVGGSMGPQYDGEVAVYSAIDDPDIGDRVIYYSDDREEWLHHRIVKETPHGFVAQGDAVEQTDYEIRREYVTEQNYAGKILFSI